MSKNPENNDTGVQPNGEAEKDKQPFALAFRLGRYLAAKNTAGPKQAVELAANVGLASHLPGLFTVLPPLVKTSIHVPTFPDGIACAAVLYKDSTISPSRLLIGTARALEGDPTSWLTLAFHGGALLRNGKHAQALDVLTHAARLHGKPSPLTHTFLALASLELGQTTKAKEYLAQAQPAKDAPWEDGALYRLLAPEVEAALAKSTRKQGEGDKYGVGLHGHDKWLARCQSPVIGGASAFVGG